MLAPIIRDVIHTGNRQAKTGVKIKECTESQSKIKADIFFTNLLATVTYIELLRDRDSLQATS